MKKIFTLLTLAATLTACDLETSDNGQLDGLWQLTTIDTHGGASPQDLRTGGISWAFQGNLLELRQPEDPRDIIYRFRHTADSLILTAPYISEREEGDIALTDVARLNVYGIDQLEPRYHVLQLSKNTMVLECGFTRLSFRKY